jgi:hypothetical protein
MTSFELTIPYCLREISTRLTDAAAIAKAAVACAEAGSESEAVRIAMDLDELVGEAETLHRCVCLISRLKRDRHPICL